MNLRQMTKIFIIFPPPSPQALACHPAVMFTIPTEGPTHLMSQTDYRLTSTRLIMIVFVIFLAPAPPTTPQPKKTHSGSYANAYTTILFDIKGQFHLIGTLMRCKHSKRKELTAKEESPHNAVPVCSNNY